MRSKISLRTASPVTPSSVPSPPPSWPVRMGCCMEGTSGASAGVSPGDWTRPSSPPAISDEASEARTATGRTHVPLQMDRSARSVGRGERISRACRTLLPVSAAMAVMAAPASASVTCHPRFAGTGAGGLAVVDVRAAGTTCRVARRVAIASNGHRARVAGHTWSCRITRRSTGSDPGYYPYTDVTCRRGDRAVKFHWSS